MEKTEEKRRGVGEEGRGGWEERSVSVDCGVVVLLRSSSG